MKPRKPISKEVHFRLNDAEWEFANEKILSGEYSGPSDLFREAMRDFRKKHGAITA